MAINAARALVLALACVGSFIAGCGSQKPTTEPVLAPPASVAPERAAPPPSSSAGLDPNVCCEQCLSGSSADPAGMDIRGVQCTKYKGTFNGRPAVDDACYAWFSQNPMTVGSCQAKVKP